MSEESIFSGAIVFIAVVGVLITLFIFFEILQDEIPVSKTIKSISSFFVIMLFIYRYVQILLLHAQYQAILWAVSIVQ